MAEEKKSMEEYESIYKEGRSLLKEYEGMDFAALFRGMIPMSVLYSKLRKGKDCFRMGYFNGLIDVTGKMRKPGNISSDKPKGGEYFVYYMDGERPIFIQRCGGDTPYVGSTVYLDGGVSLSVNLNDNKIGAISKKKGGVQLELEGGIYLRYLEEADNGDLRCIEGNPACFIESILSPDGHGYYERKVVARVLRPLEETLRIDKEENPYPFVEEKWKRWRKKLVEGWGITEGGEVILVKGENT